MDNIFKFDTKWTEQLDTYTKAATESAQEFEKISMQVAEQLSAKQQTFWTHAFDSGNQMLSLFSANKDIKDVAAQQMEIITDYNQKAIEVAKDSAEIVAASKSDYQAWLEKGMQTVAATTPLNGAEPARKSTKKAA